MSPEQKSLIAYAGYQAYKASALNFFNYRRRLIQNVVDEYGLLILPFVLKEIELLNFHNKETKYFYTVSNKIEQFSLQQEWNNQMKFLLETVEEMYAMKLIPYRSDNDELGKLTSWAKEKDLI